IDRHLERAIEILAVEPFTRRACDDFPGHFTRPTALFVDVAQLVTNRVGTRANFFETDTRRQPLGRQRQVVNGCKRAFRSRANGFSMLVTDRHERLLGDSSMSHVAAVSAEPRPSTNQKTGTVLQSHPNAPDF